MSYCKLHFVESLVILCHLCSNGIIRDISFEDCHGSDPSSHESNKLEEWNLLLV